MATLVIKSTLLFLYLLICSGGFAKTGFYLTYPCKEGNAGIIRIDRSRKGACITPHPLVTVSDLHAVSHPVKIGNDSFFDIQLTHRGFNKLEQVYPVSDLIVFMVGDRVVFLMDTKRNRFAGTIRVHSVGRKDIARLYPILAEEIARSKEQ